MKVLLLNQCFRPDVVATAQQLTDVAVALAERGHDVTVVAGNRGYDDPELRFPKHERWRGITVRRIGSIASDKKTRWRRVVNFGSFLAACALRLLFMPGQDVVLVLTSPPLISWLGSIFTRLKGGRLDDIAPDHLFFFDRQTVQSLLFRTGFEHVAISRRGAATEIVAHRSDGPPPISRSTRLTVVMPVFNERDTFLEIFEQVHAKTLPGVDIDLLLVESNSTDGTRALVQQIEKRPRVVVIYEDRPRGKGHAVRAGLAQASGDLVLIQDADLEYDVDDYDQLVEPIVTGRAAFVLGVRHGMDGKTWKMRHFADQVVVGQAMNVGHLFFTGLFNVVYGQRMRDPFTMFKVFRRDCLYGLTFESNRFDFDWELVAKLVRAGYIPLEIPVNYSSRSFSKGKKVSLWRDPWTFFRACFKYRFVSLGK